MRIAIRFAIASCQLLIGSSLVHAEMEPVSFERIQLECLADVPYVREHALLIDTQEAYQAFISAGQQELRERLSQLHMPDKCANYAYPEIDFSTKTLLGIIEHGSGGCRIVEEELWQDEARRQSGCRAVVETSHAEFACTGASWLLIPKMPAKYAVTCDLTHRYLDAPVGDYLVLIPPAVSRVNVDGKYIPMSVEQSEDLLRRQREFYRMYHGQRVVIEGIFESSFEHSSLAGLWLDFMPEVAQQFYATAAYQAANRRLKALPVNSMRFIAIPVKCWGTLKAAPGGGYGHLGQYPGQLTVERIETISGSKN